MEIELETKNSYRRAYFAEYTKEIRELIGSRPPIFGLVAI